PSVHFSFLLPARPPYSTLFPYTTLFRSLSFVGRPHADRRPPRARRTARPLAPRWWPRRRLSMRSARRNAHVHQRERVRHAVRARSEEHTSELQSRENLVCRLLLEKKKKN